MTTSQQYRYLTDEQDRSRLIVLKAQITPILANNLLPHYTDHSVAHSDRITELIDQLIEPLQIGSSALNRQELIILYAACYLHDIGMQYERAGEMPIVVKKISPQTWADLSEETRRQVLRRFHNRISAEMVMLSVRSELPPLGLQLTEEYYPKYVAAICEAHTLDVASARYLELIKGAPSIRLRLISGLLRVADLLDLSRRRVSLNKARTLDLDLEAWTHWWRHYYIEEVEIDPIQKLITLWFDYPATQAAEYAKIIPPLQMPVIEKEVGEHLTVFHENGLGWSVGQQVVHSSYSGAETMPEEVAFAMLKQLHQQKQQEAENHRQAILQVFEEARPALNRRLQEIESNKDENDIPSYLSAINRLAADMSKLGGKRGAWILLSDTYSKYKTAIKEEDRLEIGVLLAEMKAKDGEVRYAVQILQELLPIADRLPDEDKRKIHTKKIWASLLFELGVYDEGVTAAEKVVQLSKSPQEKKEFEAMITEMHFLQGNLDAVILSATKFLS